MVSFKVYALKSWYYDDTFGLELLNLGTANF